MNVLCNCGGRTGCIQRFCDSIPLVQARTDDVLAVADCIEDVRQALPSEVEELTAQWKMLVRAKFRKAVAALNEPGAVLPGAAAPAAAAAAPVPAAAPPPPEPSDDDDNDDDDDDDEAPAAEADAPDVGLGRRAARRRRDAPRRRHGVARLRHAKRRGEGVRREPGRRLVAREPSYQVPSEIAPVRGAQARRLRRRGGRVGRRRGSAGAGKWGAEQVRLRDPPRRRQEVAALRLAGGRRRVFPDLTDTYISRLISKKPSSLAPQHIRDKYEARNAVDESDSDSDSDSGSEEAPAPAADDAAAEAPAYKVGDRVKARYRGAWGAMYEGTIKAVKAGGDGLLYAVDFDDGDYDGSVKPCHIKALRDAAPRPAPAPAPAPAAADEDSDSDTEPSPTPERRPAKRRRSDAKPAVPALVVRNRRGVANHGTLAGLIAAGLIAPGPIIVEWHRSQPDRHRAEGTLLEDGRLQYKGKTYDSPAAFTKATGVTAKHNAYHVLFMPDGTPIQSFRGGANKGPVPLGQTVQEKAAPKRARAPSASSSDDDDVAPAPKRARKPRAGRRRRTRGRRRSRPRSARASACPRSRAPRPPRRQDCSSASARARR